MTERGIRFKPRRGDEVLRAAPPGSGLYLYSSLASDPRSPLEVISSLRRNNIILLQQPYNMKSGHWIALSFHPEIKEAYYFSSYGGRPDEEKNIWIPYSEQVRSGQQRNIINDGLKELAKRGWTIYYNDYPYQVVGDDTATCGIWSAAFLNAGQNPDVFALNHRDEGYYYKHLFQ